MTDSTEGIVAAIATAGGNDEVVFAAGDRIVKDDFGGDDVAFNKRRARQFCRAPISSYGREGTPAPMRPYISLSFLRRA